MNFSKQITKSNNSNNSYICDTILLEKDLHQKDLANFALVWLIQSSKVCSQRILLRYFWISLLSYYLFQFSGFYKIPCNWRTKQDCDIGFWKETDYQITKTPPLPTPPRKNKEKKRKKEKMKKSSQRILEWRYQGKPWIHLWFRILTNLYPTGSRILTKQSIFH